MNPDEISRNLDVFLIEERLRHEDNLENYKGKWKNLWFTKDGQCFKGAILYESEKHALDDYESVMANSKVKRIRFKRYNGHVVLKDHISYSIQIPAKEG